METYTGTQTDQSTESYCTNCNTILARIPKGDLTWTGNTCSCSWKCCKAAQPSNNTHAPHIKYRPSPIQVTEFTWVKQVNITPLPGE